MTQIKTAIDARKRTPLYIAILFDRPNRAYIRICITISTDHRLRAPTARIVGSMATQLRQFVRRELSQEI